MSLLARMKARQEAQNNKKAGASGGGENKTWEQRLEESIFFFPNPDESRSYSIRILPYWDDPKKFGDIDASDPFKEVFMHWRKHGGLESHEVCLNTYGEKCPVCEFATYNWFGNKELGVEATDEMKTLAKKLFKNPTYYSLVYVKGFEHLGPRWMRYSKTVAAKFMEQLFEEEYGQKPELGGFLDLTGVCGASWKLKYTTAKDSTKKSDDGRAFAEYDWSFSNYIEPLLESEEANLALIESAPSFDEVIQRKTYDELDDVVKQLMVRLGVGAEAVSEESEKYGGKTTNVPKNGADAFGDDVPF